MAGRPMTASSDTVEAPARADDEMGLRDPHRQIGKERLDLGIDAKAPIGVAHPFLILAARLLNDDLELLPGGFRHKFDRGRHDVRKNPGALRAAGNEDSQLAI